MSPYLRIPTRSGQNSTYRGPAELPDLAKVQWNPQLSSWFVFEASGDLAGDGDGDGHCSYLVLHCTSLHFTAATWYVEEI